MKTQALRITGRKAAAPVAGAASVRTYAGPIGAVMGTKYAKDLAGQIKLMEELAKKLAEIDYIEAEPLDSTPGRETGKHTPGTSSVSLLRNDKYFK